MLFFFFPWFVLFGRGIFFSLYLENMGEETKEMLSPLSPAVSFF